MIAAAIKGKNHLSIDHVSSVRVENLAGHIGGVVTGNENECGLDLVRLIGEAHRRVGKYP